MQDREPQVGREGRVRITQDDGTVIEGVLEMADNATIEGTPYNKATQLSDSVAQALKLTPVEEATVNDALGLLPGVISDLNNVQLSMLTVETGEYTGTGTCGSANRNSITFSFVPDLVFIENDITTTGSSEDKMKIQLLFQPKRNSVFIFPDMFITSASTYDASSRRPNLNYSIDGNTISWYFNNTNSSVFSYYQLNGPSMKYSWVAIGQKFDNTVTVSCKNSSGQLQDGCVVTLGENDPVVSNSTEPLVFKTVSQNPVLTVVSPIDYGGVVQTQTLDLSNTQNLSVDVTVDTSTHLTSGTITSSIVGAFSSQVTSVDVFCLGGGGNGAGDVNSSGGGAGGGGAIKNGVNVTGQIISMIPGGRSGTSTVMTGSTTVCQATGGRNGSTVYDSSAVPGSGTVGDTLMTGAKPAIFHRQYNYHTATMIECVLSIAANAVAGNVVSMLQSAVCGGCGGGRCYESGYYNGPQDQMYVTPNNGYTTDPLQGGGAVEGNATSSGSGGGARGGLGTAGLIEWRVAQ